MWIQRSLSAIFTVLVFFSGVEQLAADSSVNLLAAKGVKYKYLDEQNAEIPPSSLRDPSGNALIEGLQPGQHAVTTKYQQAQKKQIRVLIEFPAKVSPERLEFAWMYTHDLRQWFDHVEILAGNEIGALKQIVAVSNEVGHGPNERLVPVELPRDINARLFLFCITQEASPDHYMLSIGKLYLYGSDSDAKKLEAVQSDKPIVTIARHYPSNLFDPREPICLKGEVFSSELGKGTSTTTFVNYFGEITERVESKFEVHEGDSTHFSIECSPLSPGYYEAESIVKIETNSGRILTSDTKKVRLGVAPRIIRSASEALASGNRFGVTQNFSTDETLDATSSLGLSWLRGLLNFGPNFGTVSNPNYTETDTFLRKWSTDRRGNLILEVKTFSKDAYDEARYGKQKSKDWFISTLPIEETYKTYVRETIARVPKKQKIFEIWNEPWDNFQPQDFVTISKWARDAIKSVRPDAIVGPNLGAGSYAADVIKLGGLEGMDMMTIHPYSADFVSSPEAFGLRDMVKSYKKLMADQLGHPLPLYITEYGWPTTPLGPMANSDKQQAQYVVRAGLGFLAEDIKAITAYTMSQPEKDPHDKEHYFGFTQASGEPKPVLLAYANLSRMTEGYTAVGDLFIDRDIGAILFKNDRKGKDERLLLVLYSDKQNKNIFLRPGVNKVTIVDIMGRRKTVPINDNRLSLNVSDDPIYLLGVGEQFERDASSNSRPPEWSNVYTRGTREVSHSSFSEPIPSFDDTAWSTACSFPIKSSSVDPNISSAEVKVTWTDSCLCFRFEIADDSPGINDSEGTELWKGDSLEIYLAANPERSVAGFLRKNDYQILVSPYSKSGKPTVVFADPEHRGKTPEGVQSWFETTSKGWRAVIAIPFSALDIAPPKSGAKLAMDAAINNLGGNHPRIQISSNGRLDNSQNATIWTYLSFK